MTHQFASVHPEAIIGKNVTISPFVTIDKNVVIGDNTYLYPNAIILEGARIGNNCRIFSGAVISGIPQDLKFVGEETTCEIGDNTTIRECATVNRGTASKGKTIVGSDCLLMAYSHTAHDCVIHNHVILGNATQLAGEVEVDDYAILSGGSLVHQFSRIGKHVMLQGGSKVSKDIPPYIVAGREPLTYSGVNIVGLRRRGFTTEQISGIQEIYRILYQSGLNNSVAIEHLKASIAGGIEKEEVVTFVSNSLRGVIRGSLD
ncbi:MAG: Acyl-[acyl-carrier-protein]--UDP-N-acetylglucosamine O-acyltransferase [Candidatus Ordinivivax streblomastigis]|jgi:UDP-N-acetylglucosamine acyltransferase|uniref:Acyl-[acyl-carrier-protein]--UDP-N-acetylglucosamine O-acyltransferase n=1 Tax=Candidatus Ordinivivax streblomastigis TaxID=2540710 RepID=A0A5M8NYS0_9BACT|nr:MAG: Acyl-[acyl-carrier-protein]--UDP-N-acetylglucosamine O-acyltransferase [Candidatus Ordinivivax streblomastigis]MDR2843439.1 acyl-ACP--UDP-N-acetylglucosamine O-acyltransferase [Candidatus Symbiothrix sp.]